MRTLKTSNGNLVLLADNWDRQTLADSYRTGGYPRAESTVAEMLHERFEFIRPEQIGALTDAPILVDYEGLDYSDEAAETAEHDGIYDFPRVLPEASVWWFPDYMVADPWELLKNRGRVEFTAAP